MEWNIRIYDVILLHTGPICGQSSGFAASNFSSCPSKVMSLLVGPLSGALVAGGVGYPEVA